MDNNIFADTGRDDRDPRFYIRQGWYNEDIWGNKWFNFGKFHPSSRKRIAPQRAGLIANIIDQVRRDILSSTKNAATWIPLLDTSSWNSDRTPDLAFVYTGMNAAERERRRNWLGNWLQQRVQSFAQGVRSAPRDLKDSFLFALGGILPIVTMFAAMLEVSLISVELYMAAFMLHWDLRKPEYDGLWIPKLRSGLLLDGSAIVATFGTIVWECQRFFWVHLPWVLVPVFFFSMVRWSYLAAAVVPLFLCVMFDLNALSEAADWLIWALCAVASLSGCHTAYKLSFL
ncbi:hypothetical protein BU16DRAFT_206751 [Lophium mytilinum]|uniref:Uncharacterized protein n=1 Tax=Lophium mytilinum TaxID=390894 RepID=A0A6A6RBB0_9PEZI|nr:hypothetical protein BU16DRAFT_206751 [Lophium mytilinum]